jgi:hypothetical protein
MYSKNELWEVKIKINDFGSALWIWCASLKEDKFNFINNYKGFVSSDDALKDWIEFANTFNLNWELQN